jgi:hypothetical protein
MDVIVELQDVPDPAIYTYSSKRVHGRLLPPHVIVAHHSRYRVSAGIVDSSVRADHAPPFAAHSAIRDHMWHSGEATTWGLELLLAPHYALERWYVGFIGR